MATGRLSIVALAGSALLLSPVPVRADVRPDPLPTGLALGVVWLLLAAGILALWAGIAVVRRLTTKVEAPVGAFSRRMRIVGAVLALGWLLSFWIVMTARRPRNLQAPVIADVRTVVSAQAAYASTNGGLFEGNPVCLTEPSRCIPGYSTNAPTFLDSTLSRPSTVKGGYRRVFHPGEAAEEEEIRKRGASASSVRSYAYTAVPEGPSATGGRGYCGDSDGMVCTTDDGSVPLIAEGLCVVGPTSGPRTPCNVLR